MAPSVVDRKAKQKLHAMPENAVYAKTTQEGNNL